MFLLLMESIQRDCPCAQAHCLLQLLLGQALEVV